jgi:hypothetical protein
MGQAPDRNIAASAPSFLGLSDKSHADRERARYLLEDEPEPPTHGGKLLVLFLFIAVMAVATWHWRESLRGLGAKFAQPSTQISPPPTDTAAASPTGSAATNTDPNATSPKTDAATAPPQSSAPPANSSPAPEQPAPATAQDQPSASQPPAPAQTDATPPAATATAPPESTIPKPTPRPAQPAATQPAPAPAPAGDSLETQGENYLYGNGVPQNCDRAQKKLLSAASHADIKAYSVLGTMFATGHCAPRDLPMAYRWFAKALHQDPTNTRIEDDLKALWNQMTPDERKLALQNQ